MFTLHIEHPITDYSVWRDAFDRFAEIRRGAGVRAARVSRPFDDPCYIVVALDFGSLDEAVAFREMLETQVWTSAVNAPALAGRPRTRILEPAPAEARAGSRYGRVKVSDRTPSTSIVIEPLVLPVAQARATPCLENSNE